MSPEQARGRAADKRCDVWAFGCVLYEMLAGRRPFDGADVSEVLAFVITREPEWGALPVATPASLRRLLRRCLEKDPRRRLRDIGDALLDLDEARAPGATAEGAPAVHFPRRGRRWPERLAAAAILAAACGLTAFAAWRIKPSAPSPVTRFRLLLPSDQQFTGTLARTVMFAPDGSHLAYVANNRIYVRSMAENDASPVAGTDDVTVRSRVAFAWSPDGKSLAYVGDGVMKKIPLNGSAATTITTVGRRSDGIDPDLIAQYLSWTPAGIVYVTAGRILRVSADGGTPEPIVAFDEKQERVQDPQLLPDGRTLLFAVAKISDILSDRWDNADIVVQSSMSEGRRTVLHGGSSPRYLPSGHLLYLGRRHPHGGAVRSRAAAGYGARGRRARRRAPEPHDQRRPVQRRGQRIARLRAWDGRAFERTAQPPRHGDAEGGDHAAPDAARDTGTSSRDSPPTARR